MDSRKRDVEIRKVAYSNQKIASQLGRPAVSMPNNSSVYASVLSREPRNNSR